MEKSDHELHGVGLRVVPEVHQLVSEVEKVEWESRVVIAGREEGGWSLVRQLEEVWKWKRSHWCPLKSEIAGVRSSEELSL